MTEEKKPITEIEIKSRINIALTQSHLSIQKIQDAANGLEIREDTLQDVADFIRKTKEVDKIIEAKHKELKAPSLAEGRACDMAKGELSSMIEGIRSPIVRKYNALCFDIKLKQKQEEDAIARKKQILSGIESNVIAFSTRIAACTTNYGILNVERDINFEKHPSRQKKYGEFSQKAIDRYDELKPIIRDQKEKIKESEQLKIQLEAAQNNNNLEAIEEIEAQHNVLEEKINHNRVSIQEMALNQAPIEHIETVATVFPEVKPSRTSFEMEIADIETALKKSRNLLSIELNKEAAKGVLSGLKSDGVFEKLDSTTVGGIRYFKKTKYA